MEGKLSLLASATARHVHCVTVQPHHGAPTWFYVRVLPEKARAFKLAMTRGSIDFAAFGEVLASGYGETPPSHVLWAMETQQP